MSQRPLSALRLDVGLLVAAKDEGGHAECPRVGPDSSEAGPGAAVSATPSPRFYRLASAFPAEATIVRARLLVAVRRPIAFRDGVRRAAIFLSARQRADTLAWRDNASLSARQWVCALSRRRARPVRDGRRFVS